MGTDRLVYFRTDGNSRIATGHLVRCLSIADACLSLGMKVCFLVSDPESKALLRSFDSGCRFPVRILSTASYNNLEKELPEVSGILANPHSGLSSEFIDTDVTSDHVIFFLDSYYVTERYLNAVKAAAKTAYLDDLQLFDYPVDLLINYDVISESKVPSYKAAYQSAARTLLGASYTPLRTQFKGLRPDCRDQVSHVLLTTGGSDPYHFSLKLAKAFREWRFSRSCQLHVVIGRLNEDKDQLHSLSSELPFLRLHENVTDMASLMQSCDLAVSAAGTTLYELCAAGVPTVSFCLADNQLTAAKAFEESGAILCAGDIRSRCGDVVVKIMNFMTVMSENTQKRKAACNNMRQLVDGDGALRIAKALSEL